MSAKPIHLITSKPDVDRRLILNDSIVSSLQRLVRSGRHEMENLPEYIKILVREDAWRERYSEVLGRMVTFSRFADFVAADIPDGLGTDIETVKKLIRDDNDARNAIDRAMANKVGSNQYTVPDNNIHRQGRRESPTGTSAYAAIRRLRKHALDPETGEILDERIHGLYERVLSGEISPNAAAIEAGFRKRMISIPVEDAERAARSIRANMPPEVVNKLASLLRGGE